MTDQELVDKAFEMHQYSYVPYSHFPVGAALLCGDGRVFTGCNVENASYGAGICAERNAALRAVFEGEKRFSEIAVVGWHRDAKPEERGYAFPCGICRQFLREFAVPGMKVYVAVSEKEADIREYTLEQLLPESFGPEDLL